MTSFHLYFDLQLTEGEFMVKLASENCVDSISTSYASSDHCVVRQTRAIAARYTLYRAEVVMACITLKILDFDDV